jgi:hypothetical protein
MGDYTAKAQEMIRGRSVSPEAHSKPAPVKKEYNDTDFPAPPQEPFKQREVSGTQQFPEVPTVHTEDPVIKPNDSAFKTADPLY